MYRVKLALSGGGINGLVHVGVLDQLIKLGVQPVVIVGTSAGSIVGGLFVAKLEVYKKDYQRAIDDLLKLVDYDFKQFADKAILPFITNLLLNRNIKNFGLLKGKKLYDFLLEQSSELCFKDISHCDIVITSTELFSGRLVIFSKRTTPDVKLADAMMASSSMQFAFRPFKLHKDLLKEAIFEDNTYSPDKSSLFTDLDSIADKEGYIYLIDGGNLGNCRSDIAHFYNCTGIPVVSVILTYDNYIRTNLSPHSLIFHTINVILNGMDEGISGLLVEDIPLRVQERVDSLDFGISREKKEEFIGIGRKLVLNRIELLKKLCV